MPETAIAKGGGVRRSSEHRSVVTQRHIAHIIVRQISAHKDSPISDIFRDEVSLESTLIGTR